MRNPERIDKVLAEISKIWHQYPDLRLGQLIQNVWSDPYYVEDDMLIESLEDYYIKNKDNNSKGDFVVNKCLTCVFAMWNAAGDLIGCSYDEVCNHGVRPYDD